ncbi:hypothetical protein [Facklamia miroungae]|nr:hypothetical protein [Facklamia miroungae]NKZ29060.1 hypothetical protein [Facklamia miroungae]
MKNKILFTRRGAVTIVLLMVSVLLAVPRVKALTENDYYDMANQILEDFSTSNKSEKKDNTKSLKDSLTEVDLESKIGQFVQEHNIEPKRTSVDLENDYRMESLLLKEKGADYGIEIISIYQVDQLIYLGSQFYGPLKSIRESNQPLEIARGIGEDFQITATLDGDIIEDKGLLVQVHSGEKKEDFHLAYFREQAVLADYLANEFLKTHHIPLVNPNLTLELAKKRKVPKPSEEKMDDLKDDNRSLKAQLKGLIPASLALSKVKDLNNYQENIQTLEDQIKLYQSKTQTEITASNFSRSSIHEQIGEASISKDEDDLLVEEYYFLSSDQLVYLKITYTSDQLLQANFHSFDEEVFKANRDFQTPYSNYETNGYITVEELEDALGASDSSAYYLMTGFSYYAWVNYSDPMRQLTASLQQNQVIHLQIDESKD